MAMGENKAAAKLAATVDKYGEDSDEAEEALEEFVYMKVLILKNRRPGVA